MKTPSSVSDAPHAKSRESGLLARLRVRLTLWYAATFVVILAMLGGGLFAAIRRQFLTELDASLSHATAEIARRRFARWRRNRPAAP
jgi:hypothetical protein